MLLPVLFAAVASSSSPSSARAVISGRVLGDTGLPAASVEVTARVRLEPAEYMAWRDSGKPAAEPLARVTTGSNGTFHLNVPPGGYTIGLAGRALASAEIECAVEAGETDDLGDISLPKAAVFAGAVVDAAAKPVPNTRVTVVSRPGSDDADWTLTTTVASDSKGAFTALSAAEQVLYVEAAAPGFPVARESRMRGSAGVARVIHLASGTRITGRVVRPDGSPAEGAFVSASGHAVRTAADGSFTLDGASSGAGEVEASAPGLRGFASARAGTASPDLMIRLSPAVKLNVAILDSVTKQPVARARLRLDGSPADGFTDRRGKAEISNLSPGSHELSISRRGYVGIDGNRTQLLAGAAGKVDLSLIPMARIDGRIVGDANHPVAGALVGAAPKRAFRGPGSRPVSTSVRSSSDGTFTLFVDARPGELTLEASAPGYAPAAVSGLRLTPGQTKTGVAVSLSRGFSVKGRVVDGERAPVAAAHIDYWIEVTTRPARAFGIAPPAGAPPGADVASVQSDKNGNFTLEHLKIGTYSLTVTHPSFAPKNIPGVPVDSEKHKVIADILLSPAAAIEGIVQDAAGGPIPAAEVRARAGAFDDSVQSGPDGRFRLTQFPSGSEANLLVSAEAFATRIATASVPSKGNVITLTADGAIRGRVEDADSRQPIPEFQIARRSDTGRRGFLGSNSEQIVQSADGTYEIRDVPPGTWTIEASAAAYQSQSIGSVDVGAGETKNDVNFDLKAGARIAGTVVDDASGDPIPGAVVSLQGAGGPPGGGMMFGGNSGALNAGAVATDSTGAFEIGGLPARETVTLTAQEYSHLTATVSADTGANTSVVIRMSSGSTIAGRLVDGRGNGVPGGTVDLTQLGGGFRGGNNATSDAGGNFEFDHEAPGTYQLTGHSASQNSAALQVSVVAGQSSTGLVLQLSGGASVVGHVTGLPPQELGNVSINVTGADGFSGSATPDSTRAYEVDGAPVGALRVTAALRGLQGRSVTQSSEVPDGVSTVTVDLDFPPGSSLHGSVTRGGSPQPQILVFASPSVPGSTPTSGRSQSDSSGQYSITGLEDGDYSVRLMTIGAGSPSAPYDQPVTVSGDTPLDIDLPAISISGTVTEQGSSDSVASASVTLDTGAAAVAFAIPRTTTDSQGNFRIDGIPSGDMTVSIAKSGWQTLTQPISVGDSISGMAFQLTRAQGITINAVDGQTGIPLSQIQALFFAPDGSVAFSGPLSLDATGRGEIPQLAPGVGLAYFFGRDYAPMAYGSIQIPSPPITVALTQGGSLNIRTDASTAGVLATLTTPSGLPYLLSPVRFAPGFSLVGALTSLPHVAPGSYSMTVNWPDGPKTYPVEIGLGSTTTVAVP